MWWQRWELLRQSLVLHDPLEIIPICYFDVQETFVKKRNCCSSTYLLLQGNLDAFDSYWLQTFEQ